MNDRANTPGPERMGRPLTDDDLYLFGEGTHRRLYEVLGGHVLDGGGARFAVWSPAARLVEVAGDWGDTVALDPTGSSGIWSGTVDDARESHRYTFRVHGDDGAVVEKSDPFAQRTVEPPSIASVLDRPRYEWGDAEWLAGRAPLNALDAPISIYEVHLGSWGRTMSDEGRFPNYRQLGEALADHALAHGFTHVELLPIMEHPFYGSWGYQTTGYFAPTARYGTPTDFMAMVDHLHQRGVGVILDWVPSHFPMDDHGLARFDGTHLFEHADPRQGFHPDWNSAIFNYGRHEVRSFLVSSAISWLDRFHVDGIRVDAVASMLYLDYSREAGEWIPNEHGGRENLEAIGFLRELNEAVYGEYPGVQTFAEESTAWPMVSRPTYLGGLGFGFKWDMGWMHDTLEYFHRDPVHRRFHHHELSFRMMWAFSENYTLPLSHDEVVHGKRSLLGQMPGDDWQRFANLRLLYGHQWTQPGKKLLFMGCELAQPTEWAHEATLDWSLHDAPGHEGVRRWVADLNRLYASEPALHQRDCDPGGFSWIEGGDEDRSVYAFLRHGDDGPPVLVVLNATPTVHHDYRLGVPVTGTWVEVANSDREDYGGSGVGNGSVDTVPVPAHGHYQSVNLTLPPLAMSVFRAE